MILATASAISFPVSPLLVASSYNSRACVACCSANVHVSVRSSSDRSHKGANSRTTRNETLHARLACPPDRMFHAAWQRITSLTRFGVMTVSLYSCHVFANVSTHTRLLTFSDSPMRARMYSTHTLPCSNVAVLALRTMVSNSRSSLSTTFWPATGCCSDCSCVSTWTAESAACSWTCSCWTDTDAVLSDMVRTPEKCVPWPGSVTSAALAVFVCSQNTCELASPLSPILASQVKRAKKTRIATQTIV